MRLAQQSTTYASPEDQSWLGSAHGTNMANPITLDGDTFLATFTTGIVPSGVALGKVTATGLYVPYTDAGTHGAGSDTMVGHLFTTLDLGGTTAATVDKVAGAIFMHGEIIEAKLPTGHGLTAAGKADVAGRLWYV